MSYKAEISRAAPTAILMVIDQSTSMSYRLQDGQTKASFLADVLNRTLYTLITNCSKADGVRDYFYVGVIAYSGTGSRNGFTGLLGREPLNAISKIEAMPVRIESRSKKIFGTDDEIISRDVKFPIWFDAKSGGKTSMCAGLTAAIRVLGDWCSLHSNSFPPTVLHITDGHPTDGDPEPIAEQIKSISTEDGNCLLFNLHVDVGLGSAITFPNEVSVLKDRYSKALFRMSSVLPPHAHNAARAKGYDVRPGARGFVYNAGIEAIVDFFDIGTRPAAYGNR